MATHPSYKNCVGIYFAFIRERTGLNPNFDAKEGRALKMIIKWIEGNLKEQDKSPLNIEKGFKFILDNYDKWEPFYQNQLKLIQINSNIINIVNQIKNAITSNKSKSSQYTRAYAKVLGRAENPNGNDFLQRAIE